MARMMSLGVFASGGGHHLAGWRLPSAAWRSEGVLDYYVAIAKMAEAAKFDLFFLADQLSAVDLGLGPGVAYMSFGGHDPLTLLPAIAARCDTIGLIATATTTYNDPYHIARKFATLDVLSGGRGGWNLVTSGVSTEAQNFGRETHVDHGDRYEIANEFVDVVMGLWDSYEHNSFVVNRETGLYVDLDRVHAINHKGPHFSVRGPLTVERSPQGRPILVQAGSSEAGILLAGRTADVVFTAQNALQPAQAFYTKLKGAVQAKARNPDHVKILPGLIPIVGRTQQEADAKLAALQSLIHEEVAISLLKRTMDVDDLSDVDLNAPPPERLMNLKLSRVALLLESAKREGLTMWQVAQQVAIGRGHCVVVGTPNVVADHMQTWFESGACDGFNIMPPSFHSDFLAFTELVVPELQARGLFRTEYQGTTLRQNLGLPLPKHGRLQ